MTEELHFTQKPLVVQHPAMSSIKVRKGIVYRSDGDEELLMDVAGEFEQPTPAIIFVHGGPIRTSYAPPKDWQINQDYVRLAACHGFVGVTFNHRFYAREQLPQSIEDVEAAVGFVRENSAEFNIDPDRICIWAFSGGGNHLPAFFQKQPDYLRCIISFYARHPDNIIAAAANNKIPYLIIRAGKDAPDLNEKIDQFVASALAANLPVELINNPDGEHGFDFAEDDDPPALLEMSQRTITQALAFAQAYLLSKNA